MPQDTVRAANRTTKSLLPSPREDFTKILKTSIKAMLVSDMTITTKDIKKTLKKNSTLKKDRDFPY